MALTIVGTATLAATSTTDPEDYTIPLPTGTVVGDYMLLGFRGFGCVITDARLTGVEATPGSPTFITAAHGSVTDLSDVDVRFTNLAAGHAFLVVVRGMPVPVAEAERRTTDTGGPLLFAEDTAALAAVAFASVSASSSITLTAADSPWVDLGVVDAYADYGGFDEYQSMRAMYYDGSPVPDLNIDDSAITSAGGATYSIFRFYPSSRPRYLRQRQSPAGSPARLLGPQLRQRQTFIR